MNRKERTEQKIQELFHCPAADDAGTDGGFMQILQGYIFGDVCYTGSFWMRDPYPLEVIPF